MWFKVRIKKRWEDLGVVFEEGQVCTVAKLEVESDFFSDGYHLIPREICETIGREPEREGDKC